MMQDAISLKERDTSSTDLRGAASIDPPALPAWARTAARPRVFVSDGRRWAPGLLVAIGLGLAVCLNVTGNLGTARFLMEALIVIVFALLALACWQRDGVTEARARELQRKLDIVFENAGISLWLEDWTPVAKALMELMASGVHDMRAYFTENPAAARALRHAVLVKDVNLFTAKMMGAPDKSAFIGSLDKTLPDTDQTFIEWLVLFQRGEALYRSETHITRPDGTEMDCLFTAALPDDIEGFANILVSAWDITEHKTNQRRLTTAEMDIARVSRITTVGALTASIAHELNSPLAAIVSNAEAALRWLRRPEPDLMEAEAAIEPIVSDSIRAREVVARTRSFMSNAPRQNGLIDLAEIVRQSVTIIDRELRAYHVSFHFDADDALPFVLGDPVQMQQVMVNLMINGAQAMSEVTGPRDLTVTVRHEAKQLRVTVRDIGSGIENDRLAKIFNPFFSTKPNGVGMGLAICKNCVEAHGGRLKVETWQGEGSLFSFTLPVAADQSLG